MKTAQEKLVLAGMVLAIVVLAGVLFWLSTSKNQGGISLSKSFAAELHEGIRQEWEINQALVLDLDEEPVPAQNREPFFLLQNVARAYQHELEWLKEKENESFLELQTENNWAAQNALKKEIGWFVLFPYLQIISSQTVETVSNPAFDREQVVLQAEQELPFIKPVSLLPAESVQQFAAESGLTKEQVREGIQNAVSLFVSFKKTEFENSVTGFEKAVMAQQLLSWRFLLEAVAQEN